MQNFLNKNVCSFIILLNSLHDNYKLLSSKGLRKLKIKRRIELLYFINNEFVFYS